MSDLISRKAILKHIEEIRQGVQMMDDVRRASIIMNGMDLCEEAVMNQPSTQPISENDLIELQDRYGDEVRFVVEDMLSGEEKRWTT